MTIHPCRARVLVVAVAVGVVAGAGPLTKASAAERRAEPSAAPVQAMNILVRGAVARVEVSRRLNCTPPRPFKRDASTGQDVVLDVALPAGAALLDVTVSEGGRPQVMKAVAAREARDAYVEALRALALSGSEVPFEDEAGFRFRAGCNPDQLNKTIYLRYTFTVLLDFSEGHFRLAFPAAAELSPPPTQVAVRVEPAGAFEEIAIAGVARPLPEKTFRGVTSAVISARNPWIISFIPAGTAVANRIAILPPDSRSDREGKGERAGGARLVTATSVARRGSASWFAYALGATPGRRRELPDRVIFLIDRSRSVGAGGLEAERDTARRILEALPPSTRFDALFFEREVKPLFHAARTATRAAISALDDEMVAARLANGTELAAALRAAHALLTRDGSEFSPRCLIVLLTDGAVGVPARAAELPALLAPPPGMEVAVAVVSVRPNDDPLVSAAERQVLRRIAAAGTFGVERTLKTADIADGVPALLESLRLGGDVYGLSLSPGDSSRTIDVVSVGTGASGIIPMAASITAAAGSNGGGAIHARVGRAVPTAVDPRWIEPLAAASALETRLLVGPGFAALVEPVIRPTSGPSAAEANLNPAGYMERSVVRDALSLAFTPRARACYLNRSARSAAERDLSGRVRMALDLVRGEVGGVRVEASTLAHPLIETCLREAAFAIEVPRAYRNDDPVTAVLNLVFRPRTPDRRATIEQKNPSISQEIDMLVEAALKDEGAPDGGVIPFSNRTDASPRPAPDAGR